MENRIAATLSVADRQAILNAIAQIRPLLPYFSRFNARRTPGSAQNGRQKPRFRQLGVTACRKRRFISAALIVYQSAKRNRQGSALDGLLDGLLDALGQRFAQKSEFETSTI
jgi:hypothetical protein